MHKRADRFLTLPKTGEGSIKGKDGSNVSLRLLKKDICAQPAEYPPQKYRGSLELPIKHLCSNI